MYWNKDAILNALKWNEKYVRTEYDVEMMWYEWKKVHIVLPAVWNFKGYEFDYFVSEDFVAQKDFENNPELGKKSYSMNDISKLLEAVNKFMAELGCETDWDGYKYENELKLWETGTDRCKVWNCLKFITWLESLYWLKDNAVFCAIGGCYFDSWKSDDITANLFLRPDKV